MPDKNDPFDAQIDLGEEDLHDLFEPFDPERISHPRFPEPGKRPPIILAHGIARPDYLLDTIFSNLKIPLTDFSLVSDRFHYFRGIASYLRKYGFEVYHGRVSFAADVATRARDLRREIMEIMEKTGHQKVHIIAHSMGGLDARYMIVHENMAGRVATLTTVGTPHRGTTIADFAVEFGLERIISTLRALISFEGISSCTTRATRDFNREARDAEVHNDVIYQTYASKQTLEKTFLPFQISWKIIQEREGENDGLVGFKSQMWNKRLVASDGASKRIRQNRFPILADHMDQIGWWNLNEIHKAGWWNLAAMRRKAKYETLIKNIYLKIAREVYTLM